MKRVFVLGGSCLQIALLEAAKNLNYEVFLFDRDEFCVGKATCDKFFHIDIVNHRAIYDMARKYRPKCICTIANELGNVASNVISKALGLAHNPPWTVLATINKLIMRNILHGIGLYERKSYLVQDSRNFSKVEFPCIVKPVVASASRGVQIVNNRNEFLDAVSLSRDISGNGQAMVEEIFMGDQYSVETMSFNGVHHIMGITEEYIDVDGGLLESQDIMPARISQMQEKIIKESSVQALNALGLLRGASHIELLLNDNFDVEIIEVASRLGFVRHELLYYSQGVNASSALISCLTGNHKEMMHFLKPNRQLFSAVKMLYKKEDVDFFNKHKDSKEVKDPVFIKDSVLIHSPSSMADMVGYYFVQTESESALEKYFREEIQPNLNKFERIKEDSRDTD